MITPLACSAAAAKLRLLASVDGQTVLENNVHAKTGSFANVCALSGYVQTADGEMLAFSILVNNFLAPKDSVERIQDNALIRMAGFSRKTPQSPAKSQQRTPNIQK